MTQSSQSGSPSRARVGLRLEIEESRGRWRLEEESVPETPLHDAIIELLMLILKHWARAHARNALVTSNLGCRWDPADARVGVDPDVVVIEPAPPEGEQLTTLRVWEPGHTPPRVAVEIVSANTADKDDLDAAARCARLGARELWIFDPRLEGPTSTGGPHLLQVWRDVDGTGEMTRVHAGAAPAYSQELEAWLVTAQDGSRLRLASDAAGSDLWPTETEKEAQRAQAEAQRAQAEARRAQAEARRAQAEARRADEAEAEVARLRKLLGRGG